MVVTCSLRSPRSIRCRLIPLLLCSLSLSAPTFGQNSNSGLTDSPTEFTHISAPPTFAERSVEQARSMVIEKINQAKTKGVGIQGYMSRLSPIDLSIKKGDSEDRLTKQLDEISAAIDKQLLQSKQLKNQIPQRSPSLPTPASSIAAPSSTSTTGKPSAPNLIDLPDSVFQPYMADLPRRLKRSWFPPKYGSSYTIVTVFKIHASGTVSDLQLQTASGQPASVDQESVRKAVLNAEPFRKLPADSPDPVDARFTFEYKVNAPNISY